MKTLIGGAIAAILGCIGIVAWFPQFLTVVAGTIPVMLLLGGALAIYLGVDELKDTWTNEENAETESETTEEVEKYKQEISELKEEIESLKKEYDITLYFYNPNIHPYQEYLKRLHCVERYTALVPVEIIYNKEYDLDKYLVGALQAKYDPPEYLQAFQKTEKKNGGFQEKVEMKESLQIKLTAKGGLEASSSTININDLKSRSSNKKDIQGNSDFNPRCGYCINLRLTKTAEYAAENGFDAFTTTLLESKYQPHEYNRKIGSKLAKKYGIEFYYQDFRAGWKESIRFSKELQLYRQQYCGCIFSEYERFGPEVK